MKFVIFNLIVVVSLVYLIIGNKPGLLQSLKDRIHSSELNVVTHEDKEVNKK